MKNEMRRGLWLGLALTGCASGSAGHKGMAMPGMEMPEGPRVDLDIDQPFSDYVPALVSRIEAADFMVVARVDHQEMLKMVQYDTRGSVTVEFGNPKMGKMLFMADAAAALEMPVRILVQETADGKARASFYKPSARFAPYQNPMLDKMGGMMDMRTLAFVKGMDMKMEGGEMMLMQGPPPASAGRPDTRVDIVSKKSFDETAAALGQTIESMGLMLIKKIDHQMMIKQVTGADVVPAQTLEFGKPAMGKMLFEADRTAALEMPGRYYVWQNADGKAVVSFHDPARVYGAYGNPQLQTIGNEMSGMFQKMAAMATGTGSM